MVTGGFPIQDRMFCTLLPYGVITAEPRASRRGVQIKLVLAISLNGVWQVGTRFYSNENSQGLYIVHGILPAQQIEPYTVKFLPFPVRAITRCWGTCKSWRA